VRRLSAALLAAGVTAACSKLPPPPSPEVAEAARTLQSYSANLSVKVGGRKVAPRTPVIVGFKRPDRLRLEMPSAGGARLILVAKDGQLTAVFPRARAVYQGPADRAVLGDITGVSLAPPDVMDFLVGFTPPAVTDYVVYWGPRLPRRVRGKLEDGTRLDVMVTDPAPGAAIQDRAFEPPPHERYRRITAAEARELWSK
jgi:hypothetical protein